MTTSPEDRLSALLSGQHLTKATPPAPGERTFAEKELESQTARQAAWYESRPALKAQEVNLPQSQPTTVPAAQSLAHPEPPPQTYQPLNSDSENDDDYVAAFAKKPVMKAPKSGRRGGKQSGPFRGERKEDFATDKEVRKELATADEHGNPVTGHFCVLALVAKFPYKYMADGNDRVSRKFFAADKFYQRSWDLYYIDPPESSGLQSIFLLPYVQVKSLIDEIAQAFDADVAVPAFPFTLTFFDDGTPQPRLLGTSRSRTTMSALQESVSTPAPHHGDAPPEASKALRDSFAAFKTKCEQVTTAKKTISSKKSKKKDEPPIQIRKWCPSLTRVQRYFGLLPPQQASVILPPGTSWEEQNRTYAEDKRHNTPKPLVLNEPAAFAFEDDSVLVCIDIESWERGHSLITEVGISTLDTQDLADIAPGSNGEHWRAQIRSQHFRIAENVHLRNRDFCVGDPNSFQFGSSEFVSLSDIGNKIDACLEWPFSVQFRHDGKLKNSWDDCSKTASAAKSETSQSPQCLAEEDIARMQKGTKQRNVLLVGHNLKSDLEYLAQLGSSIFSYETSTSVHEGVGEASARGVAGLKSIKEALDTATLYKTFTKDDQPRKLATVLYNLGIDSVYLHNAGNDARFTLEALVSLTLKARLGRDALGETGGAEAVEDSKW